MSEAASRNDVIHMHEYAGAISGSPAASALALPAKCPARLTLSRGAC
jgi:hypothetical protein